MSGIAWWCFSVTLSEKILVNGTRPPDPATGQTSTVPLSNTASTHTSRPSRVTLVMPTAGIADVVEHAQLRDFDDVRRV